MRKTMLAAMQPPPATVVSVARKIDYGVANYTAQGIHDDLAFSLTTLTSYVEELETYVDVVHLLREAAMTVRPNTRLPCAVKRGLPNIPILSCFAYQVWLWRGHFPVSVAGKTFYLPLHSITVS